MRFGVVDIADEFDLDIDSTATWHGGSPGKPHVGREFRTLNPDSRADRLTQLRHNCTLAYAVEGCPDPWRASSRFT